MAILGLLSSIPYRRPSLAAIDAVVSARLGPTRIPGNAQPACFNRQVAMYLAKYVSDWSTTCIGRFYNGRDHSTVIHGIQRIEALRDRDSEVDTLLSELKNQLAQVDHEAEDKNFEDARHQFRHASCVSVNQLAEAIAELVWARIEQRFHR